VKHIINLLLKAVILQTLFISAHALDKEYELLNNHCGEGWGESITTPMSGKGRLDKSSLPKDHHDYYVFTAHMANETIITLEEYTGISLTLLDKDCKLVDDHWDKKLNAQGMEDDSISYHTFGYKTTPGEKYFIHISNGDNSGGNPYTLTVKYLNHVDKNIDSPFELVNPDFTKNITGDFLIIGNTSMCRFEADIMPEKNDDANHCYMNGNKKPGNNNHYINYVDIDGDTKTWNSSAATFELKQNSEILWAGLFWQGNLTTRGAKEGKRELRVAKATASGFKWEYNIQDSIFNEDNYDEEKVLLKIDDSGNYTPITANKVYYSGFYNSESSIPKGGPYAAYSDITALLKPKANTIGTHKITVANLTAHMGHESALGVFGGWSLVVIYKNPTMHPKNISIFSGFTFLRPKSDGPESWKKTIPVKGFKLPSTGKIDASISIFTGEGEASISGDSVYIDNQILNTTNEKGDTIDPYNIFDGIPDFDGERFPNHKYTTNIDITKFDVSDIMTKKDRKTNKIDIKLICDENIDTDAYFPSMVAFSVDLYIPEVCYDYDLRMGSDIPITSNNREINTSMFPNMPLEVSIALRSREGDLALTHSKMSLDFSHSANLKFKSAKQSPDDNSFFLDAPIINKHNPATVAFGSNADITGGTVKELQTLYIKYKYDVTTSELNTTFDLSYNSVVDFGNGDVNITLNTKKGTLMQCGDREGYYPEEGIFNVESHNSDDYSTSEPSKRFPLLTKVAGKEFTLDLVHYADNDFFTEQSVDKEIKMVVELIDVDRFHVDSKSGKSAFVCSYPQEINGTKKLVEIIGGESRRKFKFKTDFALPNVAVRVKYLMSDKGPVTIGCWDNNKECSKHIYKQYFETTTDKNTKYCTTACGSSGKNKDCAICLEEHWTRSVCSRDNFAIRPESYTIDILDTNQSKDTTPKTLFSNVQNENKNLLAGYQYIADVKTTLWKSNNIAKRYFQRFLKSQDGEFDYNKKLENTKMTMFNQNPAACNDKNGKTFGVNMTNGRTIGIKSNITNIPIGFSMKNDNAGKYIFNITDKDFTKVDQGSYAYKTFPGNDCLQNQTAIPDDDYDSVEKVGCIISSDFDNGRHSKKHSDLKFTFLPDHFSLTDVILGRNPSNGKDWIYMSNMVLPSPMALGVKGYIEAKGFDDTTLTNFTSNCVADDLNITVDMHSDTALSNIRGSKYDTPVAFEYLVDNNMVPNDMGTVSDVNSLDNALNTTHELTLKKENFSTAMSGTAELNLYYNFGRTYNDPVNPIKLNIEKLTASTKGEKANGHMQTSYTPSGTKAYNEDYTFLYAATNSERTRYETKKSSVLTPLSVKVYCDISRNACKNKGINSPNALLTLPWWRAVGHDTDAGDGKIALKTGAPTEGAGAAQINKVVSDIDTDFGEDKEIKVSMLNGETPALFPIDFITDPHAINTTSDWLIYNEIDNSIPTPFYEVRFIGGSMWTGIGKTGNVVGTQGSGKRSGRLQW